ncbi:hypothetical protein RLOatenuis_2930 [Rickettsiales bacterium]|nr:hypothetical protein RLOatenuis_2930 [Rickettsiales bacterium]
MRIILITVSGTNFYKLIKNILSNVKKLNNRAILTAGKLKSQVAVPLARVIARFQM